MGFEPLTEDEIYFGFVGVGAYLVAVLFTSKSYAEHKGKVLLFYILAWFCNAVYLILESLGYLLEDVILWKIGHTILSMSFLFWMMFIDYADRDEIGWKKFGVGVAYVMAFSVWLWMPETLISIEAITSEGVTKWLLTVGATPGSPSEIMYKVLYDSYATLFGVTMTFWAAQTYKAAPEDFKKKSIALLVSGILLMVTSVTLYFIDFGLIEDEEEILPSIMYLSFLASTIIPTIVISRSPVIVHLLPYRVYRLIITSKNGVPYAEYMWSEHDINVTLLAGLFSAIGTMTKGTLDTIKSGSIKEVILQNAVFLTVTEYSPVTFGLLASKSSKDLKASIETFSKDFVDKYYDVLYSKEGFSQEVRVDPRTVFIDEDLIGLVKKHFPNVPNFIQEGMTTSELLETLSFNPPSPDTDVPA